MALPGAAPVSSPHFTKTGQQRQRWLARLSTSRRETRSVLHARSLLARPRQLPVLPAKACLSVTSVTQPSGGFVALKVALRGGAFETSLSPIPRIASSSASAAEERPLTCSRR